MAFAWLADELVSRLIAGWFIRFCFDCLGVCSCFGLGGRIALNIYGNVLHYTSTFLGKSQSGHSCFSKHGEVRVALEHVPLI